MNVRIDDDSLIFSLMDGRTITAPFAWFARLANGSAAQCLNWQLSGAGYGIYWTELDEDLSTERLLLRQGELKVSQSVPQVLRVPALDCVCDS